MSHHVDILDGTIRHQQAIFVLKILSVLGALDRLLYGGSIFRMNPLEDELQSRLRPAVILEDAKRFIGPDDLSSGNAPAETTGMTEALSFRQVRFALLQLRFLHFQGLGSKALIH